MPIALFCFAFPNARFVTGARPDQVVAWATPKDHTEIKNLIDQMIREPDPEDAPKVAVYDLKFITPASAQQILAAVVDAVNAFAGDAPQSDDLTLLVIRRCPLIAEAIT